MEIVFLWVPRSMGGHRAEPYIGMRPIIRWQQYIHEYLEGARDVECTHLKYNPESRQGKATLRLFSGVPEEWLQEGNLIELLDGYRVLAVGRITGKGSI